MKTQLAMPDVLLIGMTRGMLGAGLGLLLADKLGEPQRRSLGWGLVAVGLLTTLPLAWQVIAGIGPPAAARTKKRPARPNA